jgi:hypothetical protein
VTESVCGDVFASCLSFEYNESEAWFALQQLGVVLISRIDLSVYSHDPLSGGGAAPGPVTPVAAGEAPYRHGPLPHSPPSEMVRSVVPRRGQSGAAPTATASNDDSPCRMIRRRPKIARPRLSAEKASGDATVAFQRHTDDCRAVTSFSTRKKKSPFINKTTHSGKLGELSDCRSHGQK